MMLLKLYCVAYELILEEYHVLMWGRLVWCRLLCLLNSNNWMLEASRDGVTLMSRTYNLTALFLVGCPLMTGRPSSTM